MLFSQRHRSVSTHSVHFAPVMRRTRDRARRLRWGLARIQRAVMESLELRQLLSVDVVTNLNDSGAGSLRQTIAAAASGDTIEFQSNITGPGMAIDLQSTLVIDQNVTIVGPGAGNLTISGDGADPAIEIYSGQTVSMSGLKINGGSYSGVAGRDLVNYGSLNLQSCTITGDSANLGGGIYNVGVLTAGGDYFSHNSATYGGAIQNEAVLTVVNGVFVDNSATYGGAIQNNASVTIANSTFSGDSAGGSGGAIFNNGTLIVTRSTLSGESASLGGAIYNYGIASVENSTLSGDSAGGAGGGGIANYGDLNITNSTFAGNTALNGVGGALDNTNSGDITAVNTTISGNYAGVGGGIETGSGGDVTIDNTIVAGNKLANHTTASDIAGTIDANPGSGLSSYNLIGTGGGAGLTNGSRGNKVGVANPELGSLANNGGPTETMALLAGSPAIDAGSNALAVNEDGQTLVTDQRGDYRIYNGTVDIGAYEYGAPAAPTSLVVTNTGDGTAYSSGALTLRQAVAFADFADGTATITFNPTDFPSNASKTITLGSPLELNNPAGQITIEGPGYGVLTVSGGNSGEIFVVDAETAATISAMTISGGNNSMASGGAIYNSGALTLNNVVVGGNTASDGGAIDNHNNLTITNSTFSNNTAGDGAAIDNNGIMSVSDTTFSNNAATSTGGAIADNGNLTLDDDTFSGNTAANGGAIENNGNVTVSGGLFSGNTASDAGGAIDNHGNLAVSGAAFSDDAAVIGGAASNVGSLTISSSTFDGDSAEGYSGSGGGGGVFNNGDLTVTGSTFTDETTDGGGGGILNLGVGSVETSTFADNSSSSAAGIGGGGIYNDGALIIDSSTLSGNSVSGGVSGGGLDNDGGVTITNSTIAGNSAPGATGGGIYNDGAATITNSTIAANFAPQGGGLFNVSSGDTTIYNTIVAENTKTSAVNSGASDITGALDSNLSDGQTPSSYNLIGTGGAGGLSNGVNGNITCVTNPLLAPLGGYGGPTETMAPLPGSPAIDAGEDSLAVDANDNPLVTDQRGQPRIVGPNIDIGSVETGGYTLTPAAGTTPQSTNVDSEFSNPLTVVVTADNGLDPVDGAVVTFTTVPGNNGQAASLNAQTAAVTDGQMAVTAVANNVAGQYVVVASIGNASANFSLTNDQASEATSLQFEQQPSNTVAGVAISPAVTVSILDQFGNVLSSDNSYVTIAINSGPGGATLSGTLTAQAVNGVATFSNLSLNKVGTYTLLATDGSLNDAVSNSFNITAAAAEQLAFVQQPTNATAGAVISPAVTVAVEDQFGNLVTTDNSNVTLAINTGPAGATLSGTLTVAAVNGIATFSTLSLNKAGTYTLAATDASLAQAISSSFAITAAAAEQLAFVQQPTSAQAGAVISPAVTVAVEDQFGNVVTTDSSSVTIAINTGTAGATLSGTLTVAAVNGIATFSDLSLNKVGTYTLAATDSSLAEAISSSFTIVAASAEQLVFVQQPTSTTAGSVISPAVTVAIEDQYGDIVTTNNSNVTIAINTGPGGAVLHGTLTVAAVNGIATFSTLSLNTVGAYTLAATDASLNKAISTSFNITAAAAEQLTFVQQPTNAIAGAVISPAVTVAVEDQYGNVVTTDNSNVVIAINSGPAGATLSGTMLVAAVNGIATFSNLSLNKAGTYTLAATDGTLNQAVSSSFTITAAAPEQLAFVQEPSNAVAGAAISPAVTVAVEDQFGNVVTTDSSNVTIAINSGTAGATLSGTLTVAAVNGIATFSNLSLNKVGTYTLAATDSSLNQAVSTSFNITAATAEQLVFVQQPTNTTAGAVISPAVTVAVEDQFGNVVTTDSSNVTIAINTGPGGAVLHGTLTVAAVNGIATFSTLSLNTAGTYTLAATDASLNQAISSSFTIVAAAPEQLAYVQQPTNAAAGAVISPAVTVAVEDQYGNVVTTDNSTVFIAINSGPAGATLSGTLTAQAVNGVATFSTLSLNKAGTYTLAATDGSLNQAISASFTITAAAPEQLVFVQQPTNSTAGMVISPAVTVAVEDQFGNVVTTDSSNVTIAINSGPGGAALGGTLTAAAVNGIATFSTLSLNKAGTYTLAATDASLNQAVSASFNVTAAAAEQLVFVQQPTGTTAGSVISPAVTVAVEDQFGNVVTTDNSNVMMAINSGPAGATLSGTLTATAVNGIATFSNLSLNKAGTYKLIATDGALNQAISSPFVITAAAPEQLAFIQQPTSTTAGTAISPAVTVAVEDQFGNVVTTDSSNVTIAINSGPGGAVLGGTLTVAAVNGVATFSNLSLNKVGTYTLAATDSSLNQAVSSSFNITAAAAEQLMFVQQPTSTTTGTTISPAVTVAVEDQFGNVVTTDSSNVTIAINSGPVGATLSGTLTVAAVNGVATFSNLSLNEVGTYTLAASDASVNPAVSSSFNITTYISPNVDLSVTKSVNNSTPNVGTNVTYTVTVSNATDYSTATNVSLSDMLPAGETLVSATPSTGTYSAGVWSIPSLASGATATLTYIATVNTFAAQTNTATVTSTTQTDVGTNLSASVTVNPQEIDLNVTKTVDNSTPNVGANVTYTVTVSNATGYSTATSVSLSDMLPAGETLVSATPSTGTFSGGVWSIPSLAAGASATLSYVATVNAFATQTNTASVTSAQQPDVGTTLSATATVNPQEIDLSVTNSVNNSTPNVGSDVTYTVTVSNANGYSTANNVSLTDTLPPGETFVSDPVSQGSYNPSNGVWTIGSLAPGVTATLSFVEQVNQFSSQTNSVTVSAPGQTDANSNLTASNTVYPQEVDLGVTKAVNNSTPNVGTNVTYTVTVSNANNYSTATDVSISDMLPAGETLVSATPSTGTFSGGVWSIPSLAAGSTATLSYVAKVNTFAAQTNTASVSSVDQTDIGSTLSASVTVNPQEIDLNVTKTVNNSTPNVGSNVTYTVTVSNATGYSTATNVSLSDMLPAGETLMSATPSTGTFNAGVWNIPSLGAGASATLSYVATVNTFAAQTNTASVTSAAQPDVGTNLSASVTVNPAEIDLSVTKTVNNSTPNVGSNVTYTVTVSNATGYSTATSVSLSDLLPAGETLVSSTPSVGTYSGGVWSIPSLAAGATATLSYVAKVNTFAAQTNTATITSAAQTDVGTTLSASVTVNPQEIDLSVTKTVNNSTPNVGSNVTYTVTVSNATGYSTATSVSLSDLLPAGETLVSATPSTGTYTGGVWSIPSLAAGSTASLSYVATVNAFAAQTNTATVTSAAQTDVGTNLSASVTVNPQEIDLSVTKTVNNSTPNVGSNVTYTVTVSSASGYSTATSVSLSDLLPAGETLVSATPSTGTYTGGLWSIPSLAAGSTATLSYVATVNSFSPQTNTATVTSAAQTDVGTNLSASVTVNPAEIDLSVTKTVNNSTPNVGSNVTYTVTVSNASGYSTASSVSLSDVLPAGESLVSATPSTGTYTGGVWSIPSLAAGASATLSYVAKVNAFAAQTNTATITSAAQTEVGTTLSASVTVNPQEIDLSVTKTVNNSTPNVGTNVTYTVTVSNATGYSTATSVSLSDLLPAGETLVSATPSTGTYAGGVWSIPMLAAGSTATLSYVATVNTYAAQTNTATVTSAAQTDVGTALSASVTVNPQEIDLSVTKTVNNSTPNVGSNVIYTVTVSNATGYSTGTSVSVKDLLPAGETLVSATPSVGTYTAGVWSIPSLAAGASATLSYVATVNAFAAQTNTATIQSAGQPDIGTTLSASVTVNPQEIDLSVTKTVNNSAPMVGSNVIYTVTVTNPTGYSTATNVSLTDMLPSGETLVSATPSTGTYTGGVWTIPSLASGATATLIYTATVNASTPQTNTATITSASQTDIGSPLTASVTVTPAVPQIDLSVVKSESTAQTCLGNNVTYTVTLSNAAGYATATSVSVSDMLPSGLTFVSATPSQGTYSSSSGVWSVGTVAGGASATLTVVAKTACYGVYVNTALVTGAGQTDVGTNLQSTVTLVVGASLNGVVYQDLNGNCQQDAGEGGVAGATVELINSSGKIVLTSTTDVNGNYSFLGVAPGNFTVEFIAPSAYVVECVNGSSVSNCGSNYGSCGYNSNNNCGNNYNGCGNYSFNYCGHSYSGYCGGSSNCGYNYNCCGGNNCSYSYTYCDTGNSNWGNCNNNNNCGNNNNNNCNNNYCGNGGNIGTGCVTLVCGTTTSNFNAGVYLPGSIGNFVWVDANGNGLQDSNEQGLKNVCVDLLNSTGKSVLAQTTTNSQGYYSFTNLAPGQYIVQFFAPNGYVFTLQDVGTNNAINSDANVTTGKTNVITLTSGETDTSEDAGVYVPACVSGTVYVDYNNNGVDNGSETGLSGITVMLLNGTGQTIATTTTGCNGTYGFSGIPAGTYSLYVPQSQSALTGFLGGKDTPGTVNCATVGTAPGAGIISSITLAAGACGTNYNFGQSAQGQTLTVGDTGSVAFWASTAGQNLVNCLNGGSTSTTLGNWLSSSFANLYGRNCSTYNLSSKTNSQVYQLFVSMNNNSSLQTNAQLLACAINCYVTNSTLCGTVANNYGFITAAGGCGNQMFNIWNCGAAFGVTNYTVMSVQQIVLYCNTRSVNGVLYGGNTGLDSEADTVFTAINQAGDIGADASS